MSARREYKIRDRSLTGTDSKQLQAPLLTTITIKERVYVSMTHAEFAILRGGYLEQNTKSATAVVVVMQRAAV